MSDLPRHGQKTNIPWFDHVKDGGSVYNKTRLARNRRRFDRVAVAEQLDEGCVCRWCRIGIEDLCRSSVA